MNIIANTCVGARLYQFNQRPYSNPFMWNIIESSAMINLITHFDTINFANITLPQSDYYHRRTKYRIAFATHNQHIPTIFKIVIDNLVELHYLHYRFNPNYTKPTVHGIDVYYNKIWEYIVDKYITRVRRMISQKISPKFVITTAEPSYSIDAQHRLIEVINSSPYKMCIITNDLPSDDIGNARIIHYDIKSMDNTIEQAKTFNDQIMGF